MYQVTKYQRNQSSNRVQKVFRDQVTKKPDNLNATKQNSMLLKSSMMTSYAMSSIQPIMIPLEQSDLFYEYHQNEEIVARCSDDEEDRVLELSEEEEEEEEILTWNNEVQDKSFIVVEDYELHLKKKEEEDKMLRKKMEFLLNRSEMKFRVGKFFDSYNDCDEVETIAHKIGVEDNLLGRILFNKGRTKFKLGDVKAAHDLLHRSLHYVKNAETEYLLKEVEKMAYFESLIDLSFQNPVHQTALLQDIQWEYEYNPSNFSSNGLAALNPSTQGFALASTVRLNMPTPKMITQHRFKSGRTSNSWQNTFLLYNKGQLQETAVKS